MKSITAHNEIKCQMFTRKHLVPVWFFFCVFHLMIITAFFKCTTKIDVYAAENTNYEIGQADSTADKAAAFSYIFDKKNISVRAGEKLQLHLYIQDKSGSRTTVDGKEILLYDAEKHFTNKKIKTDQNGIAVFTFEKSGTYYVGTGQTKHISESALCKINVKQAAVAFANKSEILKMRTGTNKGCSKELTVIVNGRHMNASALSWRTENKKIVSVKNGVISAKKEGKTIIYATIYHTTAKCSVTVLDKRKLLVIDPGHQAHQDTSLEPVGPGSNEWKIKVSSGTAGKYSGSEYQLNLAVSKKLKKVLKKKNYRVLMTRTTNQVNISNKERAEIANEANADAFIRIHANSSPSASVSGILTICPTKQSPYCQDIYKKSRRLSDSILKYMKQKTQTPKGSVWETDTMTGINWCHIPVTIIELGYQSNPDEDRKLASDSYQDKLVQGIAAGLDEYFHI